MYLLSQLWWFLLLAFLLGTLLGYLLWRACGRRRIETHYARSNKEMVSRLGAIEQERSRFTSAAVDAEGDNAKLRLEVAGLQGKLADTSNRLNAAVDAADVKLKTYADGVRDREESLGAEIEKLRKEAIDARTSRDAEVANVKAMEEKLAHDFAQSKKSAIDAGRKHAEELNAAEKRWSSESEKKQAENAKIAQEKVRSELTASHAAELKKVRDLAQQQETKVLTLTQADMSARKELEEARTRHAAELKKSRDEAAAEAARKLADEVKKAREQAVAEAQFKHAEELKKVRAEAVAEAAKNHADDVRRAREDATASSKGAHDEEIARFKRDAVAFVAPTANPTTAAVSEPVSARGKAPGSIGAARGGKADDLKLVWGVGPEIEKLLNQNGIYHFDQIAAWTKSDLAWFDTFSKAFEGRVEREKWVEQSKKLAAGWRPDRDIGEKPAGLTVLRGPRNGQADDLKLIWGVGPKLEKILNDAGFFHFDQVAKWGAADIEWVDSQLGEFAGRAVRDKWVEQCKKLATGWRPASDVGEKPR